MLATIFHHIKFVALGAGL